MYMYIYIYIHIYTYDDCDTGSYIYIYIHISALFLHGIKVPLQTWYFKIQNQVQKRCENQWKNHVHS